MKSTKRWAWIPNGESYTKVEIIGDEDENTVEVQLPDKTRQKLPLRQVERANPSQFDRAEDMAELTYLNEPAVLFNLSSRYENVQIYTYSGLFLVAVNPYKDLPIYDPETYKSFHNKKRGEASPHIYAVADLAFRQMLETKNNQSILITGESGAGKTENTKKAIQYLSAATCATRVGKVSTDQKILQTNPVLESFGNAKTIRNNNSSRFGKFIRIEFSEKGAICGALIEWYLLEKSRVSVRSEKERSYHVFYQLVNGAGADLRRTLLFEDRCSIRDFKYLSNSADTIEGVDDAKDFERLTCALKTVGISATEIEEIYKLVAIVLHLGNIEFKPESRDQGRVADRTPVEKACTLMGIDTTKFINAILKPRVKAGSEWVTQGRSAEQARFTVDAFSRSLYERLFGFLVGELNTMLKGTTDVDSSTFIGVLDLAGFEIFETNSFEQLCINYTNEKLQQFFNHHMFVLEQEEYVQEKIDWDYIDYGADLQPTIDLIEKTNPMGIFSCLDEECVMPSATDKSFLDKLNQRWLNKTKQYSPGRLHEGFTISHYASPVDYSTVGWLEKNKDPCSESVIDVVSDAKNKLVRALVSQPSEPNSQSSSSTRIRRGIFRTVAQKHREQLSNLMRQLECTHPHFVRCIIPNHTKTSGVFNNKLVLDQLRCNGVLEGIRIARSGFPNRVDFGEFRDRYQILAKRPLHRNDVDGQRACSLILKDLNMDTTTYKVGLTKVFFRNGVLADLEASRERAIERLTLGFQAVARGAITRKMVKAQLFRQEATKTLANVSRAWLKSHDDPWYKLFVAMRPLLLSKESIESNRKDIRMQKLEDRVVSLTTEYNNLAARNTELDHELQSLTLEKQGTEAILQEKEEALAHLNERYAISKKTRQEAESAVQNLETECGKLREAAEEHVKELLAKSKLLETTSEALKNLKANSVDLEKHQSIATQYDNVLKEKDTLSGQVKQLESDRSLAFQSQKEAEKKLEDATSEFSQAATQVKSLEHTLEVHKAEITHLLKQRKALQLDISDRETQNSELKTRCGELEELDKQNKDKIANTLTTIARLEKDTDENKNARAELETLQNSFQNEKTLHVELQDKFDKVIAEKVLISQQVSELESSKSALNRKLADLETISKQNKVEAVSVKKGSEALQKQLNEAIDLNNTVQEKLKTTQAENESLLKELRESQLAHKNLVELRQSESITVEDYKTQIKSLLEELRESQLAHKNLVELRQSESITVEDYKTQIAQLNSRVVELEGLQQEIKDLRKQKQEDDSEVNSLKTALEALKLNLLEAKESAVDSKEYSRQASMIVAQRSELENLKAQLHQAHLESERLRNGTAYARQTRKLEDTLQELATTQEQLVGSEDQVKKLQIDMQNLERSLGETTVLRRRYEKVQREKAQAIEENSKLKFGATSQRRTSMELELEKSKSSQVKTLQCEIRLLKLQLVRSEKQRRMYEHQNSDAKLIQERDHLLTVCADMENKLKFQQSTIMRLERQTSNMPSGSSSNISIPRARGGLPRVLRAISGNDRQVSGDLRRSSVHGGMLGSQLEAELRRNDDLNEMVDLYRTRANEYQTKLENTELIVETARRNEFQAREKLVNERNKQEEEINHYERRLHDYQSQISRLKAELGQQRTDLTNAKLTLARKSSNADEFSTQQQKLVARLHGAQMTLDEVAKERDQLLNDKLKLEKRLSQAWVETTQEPSLNAMPTLAELRERAAAAEDSKEQYRQRVEELTTELESREQLIAKFEKSNKEVEENLSETQRKLDELNVAEVKWEINLRRATRETNMAQAEALRYQKELEEYRSRLSHISLQEEATSPVRPAFM